jgi:hypothetical protein
LNEDDWPLKIALEAYVLFGDHNYDGHIIVLPRKCWNHDDETKKAIGAARRGKKRDPDIHRRAWETRRREGTASQSALLGWETRRSKATAK